MTDVTVTTQAPATGAPTSSSPQTASSTTTPASQPTTQPATTPTEPSTERSLLNRGAEPAPAAGAPEKYADFKLPEGYELDTARGEAATKIFKELNLSQEGAQRLMDLYAETNREALEAPYNMWADLQAKWVEETKAEFGAAVEPGGRVITSIGRLIDSFPPKMASEFREAMDLTGVGSHPAFVRAFANIAERLSEGTPVAGRGPSPLGQKAPDAAPKSIAQIMYPKNPTVNDAQ